MEQNTHLETAQVPTAVPLFSHKGHKQHSSVHLPPQESNAFTFTTKYDFVMVTIPHVL
jgi:hypothetical protein